MSKEIKSKDGKTYVEKKPWYKKWWVWVLLVVLVFCICGAIGSCGSDDDSSSSDSSSSSNYIKLDGQKIEYTKSKKYKIKNGSDTSWADGTTTLNSATVYKLKDGFTYGSKRGRKSVQGMLAINLTIKALKDIDVDVDSGTVSIPSINEQHDVETKNDWDEIDKGMSKNGTVYVPIYKLKNVDSIKSFRFKFDGESEDTDDDNFDHTFDITVDLK